MNLSMPAVRRRVTALACALAMSLPALQATTVSPVHADEPAAINGVCNAGVLCSRTVNLSVFGVYVAKKWCDPVSGPCASSTPGQDYLWLSPGQSTPSLEDWDAFRIDAGWCYSYTISPPGTPRIRYGQRWIQVHNGQLASITGQARVPSFLCF
jgi:hypothetical protein